MNSIKCSKCTFIIGEEPFLTEEEKVVYLVSFRDHICDLNWWNHKVADTADKEIMLCIKCIATTVGSTQVSPIRIVSVVDSIKRYDRRMACWVEQIKDPILQQYVHACKICDKVI